MIFNYLGYLPPTIIGDRSDWEHRKDGKTRAELDGAIIAAFEAYGNASADNDCFLWVGRVYDFEPALNLKKNTWNALVTVIKHNDRTGDVRDGFVGHERVWLDDTRLQQIETGFYLWIR